MTIEILNSLGVPEAKKLLLTCCHSKKWTVTLLNKRPFSNIPHLLKCAEETWQSLGEAEWLEAFGAHPKIGDIDSLKKKFSATKSMAGQEQNSLSLADVETLEDLKKLNQDYEDKIGFIFIVFATGKTALEMLDLLRARIKNSRETELKNAAREQRKITHLRLEKLF